jgi:urea transporter
MVTRLIFSSVIRGSSKRPCLPTSWCHRHVNNFAVTKSFYSSSTPSYNNLQLKDPPPPPPVIETPTPSPPPIKDDNEDLGVFTAANMSMGQVIFLGSPASGAVLYTSLALGDPKLSLYAALGTITANTASKMLSLDKSMYNTGLWGYNGALIGCASSVFGPAYYPYTVLTTVLGAAATPIVCAALKSTVHTSSPQWTWSFNIVALTSLLLQHKLQQPAAASSIVTTETTTTTTITSGLDEIQTYVSTINDIGTTHLTTYIDPLLLSPLTGISQIFVVNSPFTGLGIVAATSMYSPLLAVHALGGASMGCLVGYASCGADVTTTAITDGLWGYNSALASMAIGVFYVNTPSTIVLSAVSAASAAALFGMMGPMFDMYGSVPCLTVPFCTIASATYLLGKGGHIPGLIHAKDPHSPEKNGV